MRSHQYLFILVMITLCLLTSCGKTKPTFNLRAVSFNALPSWNQDHLTEAWPAFIRSCVKINEMPATANQIKLQHVCNLAVALKDTSENNIRSFFETNFIPYKVSDGSHNEGLFTGYYEPVIKGSRSKTQEYQAPLYKRPNDLVMIENLGIFRNDLAGIRIAGRVLNGNLVPYFTHAEIANGAIVGNELAYVADPVDAFFIQIQGSAAIQLENGQMMRLTYDGTNGHPYTAIGKILVQQKALSLENVSMQSIRAWLKTHPMQTKDVLYQNASYVFFKESNANGPVGFEGVVLTPERSMAIDPVFIAYGTPIWVDITHPVDKERIQRLVIAQDKGGAIKGPLRGDYFWGTGDKAGELAGVMKSKGTYYVLLPK